MKNSLISILALLCISSYSFAETWQYDAINPDNNTRAGFVIDSSDYLIDVSDGTLTVSSGSLENKGDSTVIKGSNTASALSGNVLQISGNYMQQHNKLTLQNVTLAGNPIYNENSGSVLSVSGNVKINAAETKNNAVFEILDGAKLESGTMTVGSNGTFTFENASANQYKSTWEFKTGTNSQIHFNMGNDSLLAASSSSAIMTTNFGKSLNGIISLDFSDFVLGDDFISGNEYTISLVYNSSNQTAAGQFDDTWTVLEENVINGKFAEFVGAQKDGQLLSVTLRAIPEPAFYASAFGFIALALIFLRRRK